MTTTAFESVQKIETDIYVRYKLDSSELSFIGYKFDTVEDVFVEEMGDTADYFRLEIDKVTNEKAIYVAGFDEWCVHDEVTHLFDVKKIYAACLEQGKNPKPNQEIPECSAYYMEENDL